MKSSHKIAVVGLWHLGEVYSVCLAELGHTVLGVSEDKQVMENLLEDIPPLAEPKLAEMIAANRAAGRLSYSSDPAAIKESDVVWITFDTPVNDDDEADVGPIFDAIEKIAPHLRNGVFLVVSSQIPVGTSQKIISAVKKLCPSLEFDYAYSPENLRLGDAVRCFMEPGRVIVGSDSEQGIATFKEVLSGLNAEIIQMSPASAEMVKHALNGFLATSISFMNDIADLCEEYGADAEAVARALKSYPRIGPKAYLFAGLGFSGGTLGRDLKAMMNAGAAARVEVPVVASVFLKNKSRNATVQKRLEKEIGTIKGKTFAMFGVTYKAGTSTLRRSQPLEVEALARAQGATFRLYDAWAKAAEVAEITSSPFFSDPYTAAEGADGILIMTPWKGFGDLDFKKLRAAVKGGLFFDTCNILFDKEEEIRQAGFTYISVGR
jgi:UDPglucose 6-dehydrogenase